GEARHEPLEVRHDRGEHGLLGHELRHDRLPRARSAPPRKVPLRMVVPAQQRPRDPERLGLSPRRFHRNATTTAAKMSPKDTRYRGCTPSPSQNAANSMNTTSVIASCRTLSW